MSVIKADFNEQCYFDFEMIRYGLRDKATGKLMEVYYSGMNMGLPFSYESEEEAGKERKKYAMADMYVVEKFTDQELMDSLDEIYRRQQLAISC